MLATALPSTVPVTAVLAGLWKDDLRLGAKPALQQSIQPTVQVLQQQKQQSPADMGSEQQQAPLQQTEQVPQQTAASQGGEQQHAGPQSSAPCNSTRSNTPVDPENRSGGTSPVSQAPRAGYSSDSYWDNRYAEKSTHFDWFYNYSALASLIRATCSTDGPCLHVGCGNSGLSDGMAKDGYQVVNVDISGVVIEQMRRVHSQPGQSWEVADCRSMPQYGDASFASVLDKGTLDAVLCSSHGQTDTVDYMNEVHRLLTPGGVFLLISLGQPHARLAALNVPAPGVGSGHSTPRTNPYSRSNSSNLQPYLSETYKQAHAAAAAALAAASGKSASSYNWSWESVEVYLLPKPSLYLASEQSLAGRPSTRHAPHTDKDQPVAWLGPFKPDAELDGAIASQGLDLGEYFTAFACKKRMHEHEEAEEGRADAVVSTVPLKAAAAGAVASVPAAKAAAPARAAQNEQDGERGRDVRGALLAAKPDLLKDEQ